MTIKKINQVIKLFEQSNLSEMNLEFEEIKLSMKKGNDGVIHQENIETEESQKIVSPLVGTFYQAASPTSSPFVKVGQAIEEGQTLCVIEAMKVMNEIKSEQRGIIKEILVKNGELV